MLIQNSFFLFQLVCKCPYSCKDVTEIKTKLYESYKRLDVNSKGNYLFGLIDILPVARRRHGSYASPTESRRQTTRSYTVPDGKGNFKKVCQKTFIDIFIISPQKIAKIVAKKTSGASTFKDNRGGPKNFKFSYQDRKMIRAHINLFPRDVSHYTKSKTDKEYLSPDLNLTRLYSSFITKYPTSIVTHSFYRKVI